MKMEIKESLEIKSYNKTCCKMLFDSEILYKRVVGEDGVKWYSISSGRELHKYWSTKLEKKFQIVLKEFIRKEKLGRILDENV